MLKHNGKHLVQPAGGATAKKATRPAKAAKPRSKHAVRGSGLAENVPDAAAIRTLLDDLTAEDQGACNKILQGLKKHLGSVEAVHIWLATRSPEFAITPLEAIRGGKAKLVLAVLEGRWGDNPAYA